jgi:hypothetical protein
MDRDSDEGRRAPAPTATTLCSALLRRAAGTIRSLDSRLVAIEHRERPGGPVLAYTFALAGREERFEVQVEPVMHSVADLYPAAVALEAALAARHGIVFQRHEESGPS